MGVVLFALGIVAMNMAPNPVELALVIVPPQSSMTFLGLIHPFPPFLDGK